MHTGTRTCTDLYLDLNQLGQAGEKASKLILWLIRKELGIQMKIEHQPNLLKKMCDLGKWGKQGDDSWLE